MFSLLKITINGSIKYITQFNIIKYNFFWGIIEFDRSAINCIEGTKKIYMCRERSFRN